MKWRDDTLLRLANRHFDLVVIGAGIVGARIAYDAARAGLSVALLDAGDFGGGTSSASSKLIHGGLRYLSTFDLELIRESQAERHALLTRVAPNLVRSLPCLLSIYRSSARRPAEVAAGLLAYRLLAGPTGGHVGFLAQARARAMVPDLHTAGLQLLATFDEAQVHDSRLVLATVRGAADAGAVVLNHAPVTGIERGALHLFSEGAIAEVRFDSVVNATGPWLDEVRRLENPACGRTIRLSKGVHVVVPMDDPWQGAVTTPIDASRVAIAMPWFGMLLLGTTDDEYDGAPGLASVTEGDVDRVLAEAGIAVNGRVLGPERVLSSFAGLRALPEDGRPTSAARREHVVSVGRQGMISVAGGKLTTHRRIALDALGHVPHRRLARLRMDSSQLPGTGWAPPRPDHIDPQTWAHLERLYGAGAVSIAERTRERPELLEPLHRDGPDIRAQWEHAFEQEWAVTADDVLRRRTTAALRGSAGLAAAGLGLAPAAKLVPA